MKKSSAEKSVVSEGSASIMVETPKVVTRSMEVFYNPVMKLNRDISLEVLKARGSESLLCCDLLAGSGARSIRMALELPKGMIEKIFVNDIREGFEDVFRKNCALSGCDKELFEVFNEDAVKFLSQNKESYDYIDIDPFGSPNAFLDMGIRRVRRGGILAVSATDTAALCGTYPRACQRKYWAKPVRDECMHERAVRILIRKCQLVGAQYDKSLVPVYSYAHQHYIRVFFEVDKGKKRVDELLAQHGMWDECGPVWLGALWDVRLAGELKDYDVMTQKIAQESMIEVVGTIDVHLLSKELKLSGPPASHLLIEGLERAGFAACATHFRGTAIRTRARKEEVMSVMKDM